MKVIATVAIGEHTDHQAIIQKCALFKRRLRDDDPTTTDEMVAFLDMTYTFMRSIAAGGTQMTGECPMCGFSGTAQEAQAAINTAAQSDPYLQSLMDYAAEINRGGTRLGEEERIKMDNDGVTFFDTWRGGRVNDARVTHRKHPERGIGIVRSHVGGRFAVTWEHDSPSWPLVTDLKEYTS